MSYGIKVVNDDSYIQIDSDTPRLCAIHNGTYQAVDSRLVRIDFPAPVTTDEPPCIFIQNSPDQNSYVYSGVDLLGSPGNWTGCRLYSNNSTWRPKGKWFCAVFASEAQDNYGMRIWNSLGGVVFDSGTTPVVVTRSSNELKYKSTQNYPPIGSSMKFVFTMDTSPMKSDEYFMVNPFSKKVIHSNSPQETGIQWNWNINELQLYLFTDQPGGGYSNQGAPGAVMARLPGT